MNANRKTCILMGDETLLIECAEQLRERSYEIAAIVTQSDAVMDWARQKDVRIIPAARFSSDDLAETAFDWFFSIANLRLIPTAVWQQAAHGAINFHDGPLPHYAGLNTPSWALLNGETAYGITWHRLSEGIDEGDILIEEPVEISPDDTALTLNAKCFEAGIASFARLLDTIDQGSLAGSPQDLNKRKLFARDKRPPEAAALDLTGAAADLDRVGRALTFGDGYANPLALPRIVIADRTYNIHGLARDGSGATGAPGQVIAIDAAGAVIAAGDGTIRISGLSDEHGEQVELASLLKQGAVISQVSEQERGARIALANDVAANDHSYAAALRRTSALELHAIKPADSKVPPQWAWLDMCDDDSLTGPTAVPLAAAALARICGSTKFHLPVATDNIEQTSKERPGAIASTVPLAVEFNDTTTVAALAEAISASLADLKKRGPMSGDLLARNPDLHAKSSHVALRLAADPASASPVPRTALTLVIPTDGGTARLGYDAARIDRADAKALATRLHIAISAAACQTDRAVMDLPLLTTAEETDLLVTRNATAREYDTTATMQALFEAQVDRTPDAEALVCEGRSLTYAELEREANGLANKLIADGIAPGSLVGLHIPRSADLVIATLAVLKTGAAYVPVDPTYPAERKTQMVGDSGLAAIVASKEADPSAIAGNTPIVFTADVPATGTDASRPEARGAATDLAYVIYTSGSTGRPKGVMVEHRNVVNFFVGMDERIPRQSGTQPVWLAVTSLSFDISVLELFWTLSRGFKVVILADNPRDTASQAATPHPRRQASGEVMGFGLFYWGNDDGPGPRKYQLLLEGARFADEHGFNAVWTPERHFHAFGGPYPNPSVTGAAVAAITKNLDIRAGSCVLPLHHPARVAEEWSVIDNISNGRVGLAFASGWMPEDFLLRPENAPPRNKPAMLNDIEVVRKLWRGEKVEFEAPNGKMVPVTTLPRPVQKELPVWVTTAGNADTFREAGRLGAGILTHLLGQSVKEVGDKIKVYREALVEHGHDPSQHKVTLMLHTLVGRDRETVREMARGPMIDYLRSAAGLIKQYAWAFPAFKRPQGVDKPFDLDLQTLEPEEMDAILEFAFLRYFDDSGLFGTVEDAVARVHELREIGVDEIACLIDYGVPMETVMQALEPLAEVVAAVNGPTADAANDVAAAVQSEHGNATIAGLIEAHGVTHLQCTPAMANMILMNEDDSRALAKVAHLFLGGEALPGTLLKDLGKWTKATVENMYGPTETTIWSSTATAKETTGTVPLGPPIANTQLYILDDRLRPVPVGFPGELYIGGDGVTRGYLNREDLTRERFLPNPFVEGGRIYKTGDVVRYDHDGNLVFLGRADHQVKVRGYRIELGEIESCLQAHAGVAEAVVIAREDTPGDVRLVGYLRCESAKPSEDALRDHVKTALPDFMVPAHFVFVDRYPLTPNAKIDRKALPPPNQAAAAASPEPYVAPSGEFEKQIAEGFQAVLGVERVGLFDNFFALGGHSLLAVKVHRDLKATLGVPLTITDIYRFPTVSGLAAHIRDRGQANQQLGRVADRAAQRRAALASRRPVRSQ